MRRIVFLLLAFLFSWQVFAGGLAPAQERMLPLPISTEYPASLVSSAPAPAVAQPEQLMLTVQVTVEPWAALDFADSLEELEDHALPVSQLQLHLDWQPFPHRYPELHDGNAVDTRLLRPPPLTVA